MAQADRGTPPSLGPNPSRGEAEQRMQNFRLNYAPSLRRFNSSSSGANVIDLTKWKNGTAALLLCNPTCLGGLATLVCCTSGVFEALIYITRSNGLCRPQHATIGTSSVSLSPSLPYNLRLDNWSGDPKGASFDRQADAQSMLGANLCWFWFGRHSRETLPSTDLSAGTSSTSINKATSSRLQKCLGLFLV